MLRIMILLSGLIYGFRPIPGIRRSFLRPITSMQFSSFGDTIFALSSGPMVKSGVAVIRVSGSLSKNCLETLLFGQQYPKPRRASLRRLYCPKSKSMLDNAIVLWFPGPRSFTGEDVVEFHVHGSRAVITGMFEAFEFLDTNISSTRNDRIRPADRGEFTRRAFDNGRMDLTEVEGLADLLAADTSEQRKQALRQMDGHLREQYESWREELLVCLAHTEAVIDFGDDDRENDVNDAAFRQLIPRVKQLRSELVDVLRDGRRGEIVREGLKVALVGPPNAGKSSLLNALARRPAAIVSPVAGTTRDIVEVRLDLGGLPCIVSDTAGLRNEGTDGTIDAIEIEGMRRSREAYRVANIRILVADACDTESIHGALTLLKDLSDNYVNNEDENKKLLPILILNKMDLSSKPSETIVSEQLKTFQDSNMLQIGSVLGVSCLTSSGMNELENLLADTVRSLIGSDGQSSSEDSHVEGALVTRERHRAHVRSCVNRLNIFLVGLGEELEDVSESDSYDLDELGRLPMDALAEELRLAMQDLGRVTGRVDVEELLDVIFRDFCIGK